MIICCFCLKVKFFSLLKQIKDRGDGQNTELNDMIEETLEFLKNWKVQSKELDSVNRKRLAAEIKDADITYITKNIMSQKVLLDCLTVESSGDCLFGIMKVYDRVFREKHTLKQICERIISAEEQKYTAQRRKAKYSSQSGSSNSSSNRSDDFNDNHDYTDETIRDRIESVYYQISNWNPKRAKEWLGEMLESNCLIWKYTSKVHIIEYMSRVKQKYDTALEKCLKSSEEFIQGNQQVTIDENFLINLQIEEWKGLFAKANKTAREWIQVVMQLFKKSLTVLLKRKKLLNLQLGTISKYDPVRTYQLEKFDGKLTGLLTALQSQKSYQISLYQGREHESTADTLQCVSKDTDIPPRTNKKMNIFHIIKEHIMTMQQGEDFINIREDLNGFEADRDKLKLHILKKPKQKDFNSSGNRLADGNRSQDQEEENQTEQQNMKQDIHSQEDDNNMDAFGNEEGKSKNEEEEEISKKKMMLLVGMIGGHTKGYGSSSNSNSVVQQKILHELTQEIKTIQRSDLKGIVRLEKANIVHQQKQYKYERDSYIRDRNLEDMQSKLEKEINKQIQLIQSNNTVPFAHSAQINNQLVQIQMQVQQATVPVKMGNNPQNKYNIRPNSSSPRYCNQAMKKKQQIEAEKILHQAQNQLQLLSLPAANHGNLMNGNSNTEDQKNGGVADKKTKKMRKVFLEIMKEKWQKKELSRVRHLEKGGNTFGNFSESKKQNEQDEETENNMPQFNIQVQKLVGSFGVIPLVSPSKKTFCFDDSSFRRINGSQQSNNFLISNQLANAESLQNQFLNMSQKNIALEQFTRSHPHIADATAPDKSVRLFQNSVKAIKILNRFVKESQEKDPSNNQLLFPQSRPQSSSPMSQGVAKKDFNIRSISPQHQKNNWLSSSERNIQQDILFDLKNHENYQNRQRIANLYPKTNRNNEESYGNSSPLSANIKRRGGKEILPTSYQQIHKEVVTKMVAKKSIEKQKRSYLEQLSEESLNRKNSREEMMRPSKLKCSKQQNTAVTRTTRQPGISLIGKSHRNQTSKEKNKESSSSQSSSNSSSFHLPYDVERELKQDLNRYFHQKVFD